MSFRIPDQPNPPLTRQYNEQDRWQNTYQSNGDPGQYMSRTHVRPAMQDLGTEKITAQTLYGHGNEAPATAPRAYYQHAQESSSSRYEESSQGGTSSLRSSFSDFSSSSRAPNASQSRPTDPLPSYVNTRSSGPIPSLDSRYRPVDRTSEQQIDPNRFAATPAEQQHPLRASYQEPIKPRSSFNERDMPLAPPAPLPPTQPRKEAGHEDEVHRLRKMLSSASAELGRQISSYQADGRGGDQYRAEWLQKLVLQMEAKQVLLESELREAKDDAGERRIKAEELEKQNNTLREQQSRILRQTPREGNSSAGTDAAQHLVRERETLMREKEAMGREKEALSGQLEELSNRHANLQRSFKIMDEQNLASQTSSTEQRQRLEEAQARVQSLSSQTTLLQSENEVLKGQLASELRKFEGQKVQLQQQREEAMASSGSELNRAASEISELRRMLEELQADKNDKEKEVQNLKGRHAEMSKELILKLHGAESEVLSLSRQLEDSQGKCTWLAGRLQDGEKTLASQSSALEQIGTHRDKETRKNQLMRDNMALRMLRGRSLGPVLSEWREVVRDGAVRLQTLYGLLKSIEVHWNRRFYKNHFLAWKFVRGRAVSMLAEVGLRSNVKLMKAMVEGWALEARATQRGQREGQMQAEFQQKLLVREAEVTEQVRGEERAGAGERERTREEKHATDIRTMQERGARERAEAEERLAEAKAAFEREKAELERRLAEAVEGGRAEAEKVRVKMEQAAAEEAEKAKRREEGVRAQVEALNREMQERLAEAQTKGAEVEQRLRTQIVQEAEKWAKKVQEAHDDHAKSSTDQRKKVLEREKEHAGKIEEMERKILMAEEEEHLRQKQREREFEEQLAVVKAEAGKATDEVVQKMYAKEKEFAARLDAARAETIKVQEDFHLELQEKDSELQRKLADKDAEFKAHLDSLLSNRVSVAIKDLQTKVTEQEGQLAQTQTRERTAQDELARLRQRCREVSQALEDSKAQLEHYQHEAVDAKDARSALSTQLAASHNRQETLLKQVEQSSQELRGAQAEVRQLQGKLEAAERGVQAAQASQAATLREKESLSSQLTIASSSLQRKDGDYSETVRAGQAKAEAAEREVAALQEKLRGAHATNDRLASELEEASSLLLKLSSDSEGSRQHSDQAVARAKEQAVKESSALRAQMDEERSASRRAHSELLDSLAAAHNDSMKAKEQVVSLERRVVELSAGGGMGVMAGGGEVWSAEERERVGAMERRLESVEGENDRLTAEMDSILVENAQLREELEDAREALEQHPQQHMQHVGAGMRGVGVVGRMGGHLSPERRPQRRLTGQESLERFGVRLGVTCGVHTVRLMGEMMDRWVEAVMRMRMVGRRQMFSCLEHFVDPDTGVMPQWPVGRVRKSELEIKAEKVGSGTFAEVFRGTIKVPCAVKRMRGPMQPKDLMEFVREGEMTRCIDHPFVAKLMGIYTDASTCALLLEYVPGCNVFDYLHKFHKTISFAKQLAIAVQVCDAMKCIHDHDIIHRDLKPQNIIYQEKTGTAKLCDFGLARILPAGVEELHPSQLGTGGTPAYQAPEVLKRQPVGKRLDQFGFAVTLWEMFTTKLPWSDCNLEQMTARVAIQNERPPIPPDMPRELASVLGQCWHRDTRARPHFAELHPTMLDMLEAVSPGSKLSSSSSVGSAGSASTASTVHTPGVGVHRHSGPASYPMARSIPQQPGSGGGYPRQPGSGGGYHTGNGAVYGPF